MEENQVTVTVEEDPQTSIIVQQTDLLTASFSVVEAAVTTSSECEPVTIRSDLYPLYVEKLTDIGDVDTAVLQNGSFLVFNSTTGTWMSTTSLDVLNISEIDGGIY